MESLRVNKKVRLLEFYSTWLFFLLDNLINIHLEVILNFNWYTGMWIVFCQSWSTDINRLSLLILSGCCNFTLEHLRFFFFFFVTAFRWGIQPWFGDVGLAEVTSFGVCCFFLTNFSVSSVNCYSKLIKLKEGVVGTSSL